jgi:hypothetical protein
VAISVSAAIQTPQVRGVVQEGLLERAYHDALFPLLLYRGEAIDKKYPGNAGDTPVFTAAGLLTPNLLPLPPGQDPLPSTYGFEQWSTVISKYPLATMDTDMPSSALAAADLFLRNCHQLGLHAAQSLNRIARDYMFNAALSGNTVATTSTSSSTSLHVQRLNGFTTARNQTSGANTLFAPVSSTNPLTIQVYNGSTPATTTVTGYTADYLINGVPDTTGPGTLTLGTAATASTRGAVISADASQVYYAQQPSALTIDALTTTSTLTLASIRQAIAGLRTQNVPKHPDGRYHAHLSPVAEEEIFGDPETQRMLTALPDYYMYREFAVGELQGAIFYENTEAPTLGTVVNSSAAYQPQDYFGGELENSASTQMQYTLFTGQDGFFEFWVDQALFLTEAGIAGRVGDFRIVNNGIDVYVDHAKIILRESLNRTQDQVSATSYGVFGWALRTDSLVGNASRYKRFAPIISS